MKLGEIMSSPVAMVAHDAPLERLAQHMRENDVGALPVLQDGKVAGMVTDRDIVVRAVAQGLDTKTTPVSDVMTRSVVCSYEDDDIEAALHTMQQRKVRRVLVMDRQNKPLGIVSLGDLARHGDSSDATTEALQGVSSGASTDSRR